MQETQSHKNIYTFLLNLFSKTNSEELKLKLARFIGEIVSKNYIGIFREPAIEQFFSDYTVKNLNTVASGNSNANDLIHVFTTTYQTGGHTRFVENLIQLDQNRTHHLIITEQGEIPSRDSLLQLVRQNKGEVLFLENGNIKSRCQQFQEFILKTGGKVMLHIHPYDILPSIALNGIKEDLEILFFNHSDHCFSYGFDVAHKVINIRDEAHYLTIHKRNHSNSFILPLPILKKGISENEINSLRLKYGIDANTKLALSIGSAYKFQRKDRHYFFRSMYHAVEANPNLKIFIVGLDKSDIEKFDLAYIPHERIQLLGVIEDPTELQAIADIAIDPMPFGSYTALLETSFYGAYPLVCYDTIPLFDLYHDPAFFNLIQLDKNESDYLLHLNRILNDQVELSREQIKSNIAKYHCGKEWIDNYENILSQNKSSSNSEFPTDPDRLSFMNEDLEKVRYRLNSFLFENVLLFNKKEVLKITLYLLSNKYKLRETLGILKKYILKN